ncbi:sensor histidine kinase YesM [Pullulanibacillus pueri]|uniref:histidine kinase n=1 Tax=Pullulanibacillus pueri TaxID=1437324 RepID=A0A8J3ELA5_9BACL|nr:sensor histidine kinase [Pullulanibacillus pueri]MBM7680755.1 sensor histidine kinase YesM [Pullulanibacillus pueri]GGH78207.1 hypothetical protein GCM10007096_11280 [Pullulanibacillus pueri]
MIRIRTKLMIFFLIVIFLMNAVAYFLFQNGQKSIEQYDDFLMRYYLLNDISQKANSVYETLNDYMVEHDPKYYADYLVARKTLGEDQEKLSVVIKEQANQLVVDNYINMITSFLDESGIVSDAFQKQNIDVYSEHLSEVLKIKQYILNTTLTLINGELTQYKGLYHDLDKKNTYFQSMGIFMFIATILLAILFALWFSRGITRPIGRLTRAAQEISKGKMDGPPVVANTRDEMRFLARTFNDMRGNIKNLIEEIEKKSQLDQLLKEMELKNLQSQINPHFLFNVLNVISKTAYLEGADRTSDLITSTASMLRHNLRNLDRPTTLKKEVEIIQDYFFIQKARFGERVSFEMDIDPACLEFPVPNLILQPIIENAFTHGVESREEGAVIRLVVHDNEDNIIISIMDNGEGIDAETKARLLRLEETPPHTGSGSHSRSTGLGFINVMKRLQLFYRKTDIFTIKTERGRGTTIQLRLPKQESQENRVSAVSLA